MKQAQLGLAHSFSRVKVSHDVNREDKPIIQAIAVIESLDKNINTFAMRLREWFSWHFPELGKIVSDNTTYAKLVNFIENKDNINDELLEKLEEYTLDEEKAREIIEASKISMGQDISEADTL
jgi:nucleolar protein 56